MEGLRPRVASPLAGKTSDHKSQLGGRSPSRAPYKDIQRQSRQHAAWITFDIICLGPIRKRRHVRVMSCARCGKRAFSFGIRLHTHAMQHEHGMPVLHRENSDSGTAGRTPSPAIDRTRTHKQVLQRHFHLTISPHNKYFIRYICRMDIRDREPIFVDW